MPRCPAPQVRTTEAEFAQGFETRFTDGYPMLLASEVRARPGGACSMDGCADTAGNSGGACAFATRGPLAYSRVAFAAHACFACHWL